MKSTEQILEYDIEKLSADNLADVGKLHAAVYGVIPRPGFFTMKYDTAFTSVKHIGFIAYNKRRMPIAFYAVIPCFIRFADKIVLAAQSADTMTHPGYRNRGLFAKLASCTFQLCRNMGIRLIFGFPNQNSLPGFINKLGWQMTERMDCFVIRSSIFPWRRLLNKLPFFKEKFAVHRRNTVKKFLVNRQGIANSVFDDSFAGVYRDHHYCRYKTYSETHVIKIGNSTLWIKINDVLLIGDISVKAEEFREMISSLKQLAARLGIKEIHFHASPGIALHTLFSRDHKSLPSFPVIFKDLGGENRLEQIKFTSADIDTF